MSKEPLRATVTLELREENAHSLRLAAGTCALCGTAGYWYQSYGWWRLLEYGTDLFACPTCHDRLLASAKETKGDAGN